MPVPTRERATTADLVALAAALAQDERAAPGAVRERDQQIGAELASVRDDDAALAIGWLDRIARENQRFREQRASVASALQLGGFAVAVLGLVLGWVAALGAFFYEGAGRVNVIAVLGILVVLPLVFLVVFLVAALPPRVLRWIPGATAWSALARAISPGRLAALALRFTSADVRDAIAAWRARAGEYQTIYGRVHTWMLLRWSQMFATAFQVAALSAALALVLFTDLVFGWSTTLASGDPSVDAARVHRITSVISAPWAWAVESAAPTVELIAESRYYRAVSAPVTPEAASRLGGWWPFVVMTMLVYGLIPRAVLWAIASFRLQLAVTRAVVVTPGVSALVRRLHAGRVQQGAAVPEASAPGNDVPRPEAGGGARSPRQFRAIINWAEVPVREPLVHERLGAVPVVRAGGAATLAADEAAVAHVAQMTPGDVAILVKAWEPPLLEFTDFILRLRRAVGDGVEIVVLPLEPGEDGSLVAGAPARVAVWRRRLQQAGDPWLRVMALEEEVRQ